ncbi:MAG: class I SAM-dependent methyltransferase [Candidatus Omnitrophota bacterium]
MRDRKSVSYHYDIGNNFYRLFLDDEMIYSCAYFVLGNETIDEAQQKKMDYICRKLRLKKNDKFLDIGCGWGGLIIFAAENYGVNSTGITISKEQYELVCQRIEERGLRQKCTVQLFDYRRLKNEHKKYDKIASIGMIEHVGLKRLQGYFQVIHDVLKNEGLFLNHGITTRRVKKRRGTGSAFMDKCIFPDAELINASYISQQAEEKGFELLDIESLRRHYAKTLECWTRRLEMNSKEAIQIAGEKTYRTWLLYLAGCCNVFRSGEVNVYQMLMAKSNHGLEGVGLTRDELYRQNDLIRKI